MSQKIQFRRGTDAGREVIVPSVGEPIWVTDTNQLWVGDGLTTGGISAGGFPTSENYVIVPISDNEIQNGLALINAFEIAKTSTPYGKPLSKYNQMTILMPGATYNLANSGISFPVGQSFISFYGLSNKENVIIKGYPKNFPASNNAVQGAIFQIPGQNTGINIENATIIGINTGWGVTSLRLAGSVSTEVNSHKFRNLNLLSSGNKGTGSAGLSQLLEADSIAIFSSNGIIDCLFDNCNISGSLYSSSINKSTFNNCNFEAQKLNIGIVSSPQETRFNNCKIIGHSGIFCLLTPNPSEMIFQNCYISGKDTPLGYRPLDEGNSSAVYTFKDCIFYDAFIREFEGVMKNCVVKSNKAGKPTFENLNPFSQYSGTFYNCTIINTSSFPYTFSGDSSVSIKLFHCELNKPIFGISQAVSSTGFSVVNPHVVWE